MIRDNLHFGRRTALRTVAGATLASVTGCLNTGSTTPDSGESSLSNSGVFQRVAVDRTTLVVEFESDAELDQVNLIQPNGELFGQRNVAAGSQQVSFNLEMTYEPGEYEVLALRDEEEVGRSPVSVQPNLQIMEMGTGRNQPARMWNGSESEIKEEAFVTLENQGTGPNAVTKLLFIGDVPYPSDEEGTNYANNEDVSGIYDPDSGSEIEQVIVFPGERLTIYSSRSPFAFVPGAGISCSEEPQTGRFDLILETRIEQNRIVETYSIQYSESQAINNCEISIREA